MLRRVTFKLSSQPLARGARRLPSSSPDRIIRSSTSIPARSHFSIGANSSSLIREECSKEKFLPQTISTIACRRCAATGTTSGWHRTTTTTTGSSAFSLFHPRMSTTTFLLRSPSSSVQLFNATKNPLSPRWMSSGSGSSGTTFKGNNQKNDSNDAEKTTTPSTSNAMNESGSSNSSSLTANKPHTTTPTETTKQATNETSVTNNNNNNNNNNKSQNPPPKTKEDETPTVAKTKTTFLSASTKAEKAVREVGQRLAQWQTSDLMAVWGILFLLFSIVSGPAVIKKMKEKDEGYENMVDDEISALTRQVIDFAREARGEDRNVLVNGTSDIVTQVLQTSQVQRALIDLASRVVQSPEVLAASQMLVKNLFKDLVEDPDTTRQVVELLNRAVRDEVIKTAVVELVLKICGDEEVMKAFTEMVVRLGDEEEVLIATQALLTDSAHKTLNDPEILDHSMEFAADVVGDDVVQRTSGEALWNTIQYSVRPGFSARLSLLGLSLVALSIYLLARPSIDTNDTAISAAAWASIGRDVHGNALKGLSSLWAIPFQFASDLGKTLCYIITFPLRVAESTVDLVGRAGMATTSGIQKVGITVKSFPNVVVANIFATMSAIIRGIERLACDAKRRAGSSLRKSFVGTTVHGIFQLGISACSMYITALSNIRNTLISLGVAVSIGYQKVVCYFVVTKIAVRQWIPMVWSGIGEFAITIMEEGWKMQLVLYDTSKKAIGMVLEWPRIRVVSDVCARMGNRVVTLVCGVGHAFRAMGMP